MHRIALDAMGGDGAPRVIIEGALSAVREWPNQFKVLLVGVPESLRSELPSDIPGGIEVVPATEVVELGAGGGSPLAYVLHDIEDLDLDPAAAGIAVVVYGHSHRPSVETRGGVLFLNPGAAGHRRFTLPVTVARLEVGVGGRLEPEIVTLL